MSRSAHTPSGDPTDRRSAHRLETWLWTGPVGHLLGGTFDFAEALLRYYRARRAAR